jgi:IS5 family transposase
MRVTGVSVKVFIAIVEMVRPDWDRLQGMKKVSGRRSHIRTLEDEVLMLLIYYRFYVSHEFLGYLFNLDSSNVCRHLKRLEPLLAKNLAIKKDRTMTQGDLEGLIVDATEINTQRPRKNQGEFYSGKKKRHTAKVEVQINGSGRILNVSKSYGGRHHDFAIRKSEDPMPRDAVILADSGYQGLQKNRRNVLLPHKRRRKAPLTAAERAHNRLLASTRVLIENVFAKLKKFKILGSVYRNFQKKLHLRFNIIAGIYNLAYA